MKLPDKKVFMDLCESIYESMDDLDKSKSITTLLMNEDDEPITIMVLSREGYIEVLCESNDRREVEELIFLRQQAHKILNRMSNQQLDSLIERMN